MININLDNLSKEITDKYKIVSNAFRLSKIKNAELDKIGELKDEMRDKNGRFMKDFIPWNKGESGYSTKWKNGRHTEETKKKISKSAKKHWKENPFSKKHLEKLSKFQKERFSKNPVWNKGKRISEETRRKISKALRGKKFTEEHRRKISEVQKGKNGNNWQDGIIPENFRIRNSIEIHLWGEAVFARDNWTCQRCGVRSGNGRAVVLHSHHIRNFSEYFELRTSIENGITLCKKCHKEFHKIYGKKNNTKEQLEEFLCQNYQQ